MQQTIQQAIRNKQCIEFTYSGHRRYIEPHVLGIKNSVVQVLGYQIGGTSSSGLVPDWRRFDVVRMSNLKLIASHFDGPRPFPSGQHSAWDAHLEVVKKT